MVVIAILAAITIVAYNGINNRAKASAASSAAQQAAKKVMAYAVTNAEQYPAALSDAGVSDSGSTSYQYRVDNTGNPKTFCLTATSQNVSFFVSNAITSATAGACAGHGLNGVAPITNLVPNPSSESGTLAFSTAGSGSGGGVSIDTSRADSGSRSARFTRTGGSGTSGIKSNAIAVSPNTAYRIGVSTYVESGAIPQWFAVDASYGSQVALSALGSTGSWRRASATYTTGPSQTTLMIYNLVGADGVYYADSLLIFQGGSSLSTAYGDGDSPGWMWNGSPNNSTSTGPPQ